MGKRVTIRGALRLRVYVEAEPDRRAVFVGVDDGVYTTEIKLTPAAAAKLAAAIQRVAKEPK